MFRVRLAGWLYRCKKTTISNNVICCVIVGSH